MDLRGQTLLHLVVLDSERDRSLITTIEHLLIKLERTALKDAISQIKELLIEHRLHGRADRVVSLDTRRLRAKD